MVKPDKNKNEKINEIERLFYGDYFKLYNAAYQVFSKNYLIGNGVKSFIYECVKLPSGRNDISCNNHPHNIYLEILVNVGIVGIFIFIIIIFLMASNIIKLLLKNNINNNDKITLIIFLTYMIAELIPFRSYGSIFQTVNGSMFWFFMAIISSKILLKKY